MDFWGFEGRNDLPGDALGLFHEVPAVPPPNPNPAPVVPPAPDPRDQPAVLATGTGTGVHYAEGPRVAAAQGALDAGYATVTGELRSRVAPADAADMPGIGVFRTNPGALSTWYTAHQPALERNGLPTGYGASGGPLGLLVGRQTALNDTKADIAATDPGSRPGGMDGIRDRANTSTNAALDAYRPRVSTASDGGGGGGGPGLGYTGTMNAVADGGVATARAVGGVMSPVMAGLGGANVINAQSRALSGGGGSSSFGVGGDGFGASGSSGMGMASFGMGGNFGDMSNTGFTLGMQGGEARSKSRQLEGMINQLLAAIMMGNLDAITSALTMCNLKAKSTMTQPAAHVVRAMQLYDRQMRTISDQMGAIAGQSTNNPNTGAQMGHLNSEMNQISMSRQAISNMLRDIMTMNEEMSNMEKSIYDVKSREPAMYRWS